ncbi:MAG: helix-turn-helix domain-containing protein [Bacteroidota bacterium]
MTGQIFAFFLGAVALYGFTLSAVLFVKKNNLKVSNRYLALILITFSALLLNNAVFRNGNFPEFQRYGFIFGSLWLLIFPTIYLYSSYVVDSSKRIKWQDILHFVPFAIQILFLVPFFIYLDESQQIDSVVRKETSYYSGVLSYLLQLFTSGIVFYSQTIIYLPLALLVLFRYEKKHKENITKLGLARIRIIRISYVIITINTAVMEIFYFIHVPGDWGIFSLLTFVVVIFFLAYVAMAKPQSLFDKIPLRIKYRSRELPEDEIEIVEAKFEKLIGKKFYLQPEINADKLARELELHPRQLGNFVQRKYGKSFPELLNELRIAEAKKIIVDPKYSHWSILAIGIESGFNSKSTFNRVFKQSVGMTPTQYLSSVKT